MSNVIGKRSYLTSFIKSCVLPFALFGLSFRLAEVKSDSETRLVAAHIDARQDLIDTAMNWLMCIVNTFGIYTSQTNKSCNYQTKQAPRIYQRLADYKHRLTKHIIRFPGL